MQAHYIDQINHFAASIISSGSDSEWFIAYGFTVNPC